MTESASRTSKEDGQSASSPGTRSKSGGTLVTQQGRTTIADGVVAKIVGMAAREVGGVHALGAGMGRTLGSMREHIPGMTKSVSQGVAVEVGEREAAVDIDVVVEYGVAIPALAGAVRENIIRSVEQMCGLDVVEVNITVDDIHLPVEDKNDDSGSSRGSDKPRESRVQ
ncbi:Asp23/Gls24 family envelope stress response protein [Actinomadura rudentiformis]|uniref:Asp23/Gls24 family envelope stress response protein n=1 Tax=Actinomadura rudentiformis TaxID=359158 RepID=A0A6H9YMK3_9ACTN|nr:Asp23/Gls24 family envelope stress response protein [Actinomadura rudentiformis]KAB2347070.1 Asp23/Gls24 family envelope stress response protein [Actinomadura rudentiformis]